MITVKWTIGDVSHSGFVCLRDSIESFARIYGTRFNFVVSYNSSNDLSGLSTLQQTNVPVSLVKQSVNAVGSGGSSWKYTPRIDLSAPELWLDNDIIFFRPTKQLVEFLSSNVFLVAEDSLPNYGRYAPHVTSTRPLNAGILGLPPGYDLCKEIYNSWKNDQAPLTSSDEQGLTIWTMLRHKPLIVPFESIPVVLPAGIPDGEWGRWKRYEWDSDGVHLSCLNRCFHPYYAAFKNKLS